MACEPCKRLECSNPPDSATYSLQDGLIFTSGTLSAVVGCPAGYVCDPGVFPHTFVYNPGGWTVPVTPRPPGGGGGPIELRLLGCQSMIFRTLPADATDAQIAAAVQSMFVEAAQQQAICDAPTIPGVRPEPPPPPAGTFSMTSLSPTTACLSTVYSNTVTATANATFSIIGTLPSGLVLTQSGAIATIAGVPLTAGSTVFGIHAVATVGGATASQQVTFAVVGIENSTPLPNANEGDAYSETMTATGMSGTLTWSATGLPSGLSINSATGEISGTPDAGTEGAYSILVTVSNT